MKNLNADEMKALLRSNFACQTASDWADGKDLKTIWATCERGDWMLWLLGKNADKPGWLTRKQVVLIACDCAETALQYVKPGETRPAECIAVVRRWANGDETVTIEDVKKARQSADAAYAAAADAADAYAAAADAAYAAAYAADAAAAYAADAYAAAADAAAAAAYAAAAYAADAYAADAYAADAYAAKKKSQMITAEICRKAFQIED